MKIGINSYAVDNDLDYIQQLYDEKIISQYECSKYSYLAHPKKVQNFKVPCSCLSSVIVGKYNLHSASDRKAFEKELLESIEIAKSLHTDKLMFGLKTLRDTYPVASYYEHLLALAQEQGVKLMYEVIGDSDVFGSYNELIDFTLSNNLGYMHVDIGSLQDEAKLVGADVTSYFNQLADVTQDLHIKLINCHYPVIADLKFLKEHKSDLPQISFENYTKLNKKEVASWLIKIKSALLELGSTD